MDPVSKQQRPKEWLKPHQWKKGQSGNPKGRPIKRPITEIYEEILRDPANRELVKQQIINTMVTKGMAGVLERREMAERVEGKVSQAIEVSTPIQDLSDVELIKRIEALLGISEPDRVEVEAK